MAYEKVTKNAHFQISSEREEDGDDQMSALSQLDPSLLEPVPREPLPRRYAKQTEKQKPGRKLTLFFFAFSSNVNVSLVFELVTSHENLKKEKLKNQELVKSNKENGIEIARLQKDLKEKEDVLIRKDQQISTNHAQYESMRQLLGETSLAPRGSEGTEELQIRYQILTQEKDTLTTKCNELEKELEGKRNNTF